MLTDKKRTCECRDWKQNITEMDGIFVFAHIHNVKYDGKIWDYCPWCGNKLNIVRRAPHAESNLLNDLQWALEVTQISYEGTFEGGYIIRVTGHEMKAIRAAIERVRTA